MFYQKIIPVKRLQKYIRYFWVLEDCGGKTFKIIPDGLSGLIFQERADQFFDREHRILPQMFIYGQTTHHSEQYAAGNFRNIGVYLQPTALKSVFNIDAHELTNQHIAIEDLTMEPILEQLAHAVSIDEKIGLISKFFLRRIERQDYSSEKADFGSMLLQKGNRLKDIQREMNLSERALERLISRYVGISPKSFSKIVRFQSGLNALRQKDFNSLTNLAYQNSYYDQSHYNREFKLFTGMNPKRFLQHSIERVENFPEWTL